MKLGGILRSCVILCIPVGKKQKNVVKFKRQEKENSLIKCQKLDVKSWSVMKEERIIILVSEQDYVVTNMEKNRTGFFNEVLYLGLLSASSMRKPNSKLLHIKSVCMPKCMYIRDLCFHM